MKVDPYRIVVFLGTVWGLTFMLLMLDTNLSDPTKFERSDYVMHFYVAGHLIATGQSSILYPSTKDASIAQAPFNRVAHSLLPHLPEDAISVFGYSPLVAWVFFQPLGKLPPHISLLVWQGISIIALILAALFLYRATGVKAGDIVFLSSLFFPLMATLWSGQVSLVFGLLPLSLGYLLLTKNRPAMAGFVWSFLVLKPQFLPVAAFVSFALALSRRRKCLTGLVLGVGAIIGANLILVPVEVSMSWLYSIKLIESTFSTGLYAIPTHLMVYLPVNLLLVVPTELRPTLKWFTYSVAAILWLAALWRCKKITQSNLDEIPKLSLILIIGLFLLPLTAPRFMYYDLCLFLPAGVLLLGNDWAKSQSASFKRIALIAWISISAYMLVFLNVKPPAELTLVLQLILLALFAYFVRSVAKLCAESRPL
jgi:hypothetical protein